MSPPTRNWRQRRTEHRFNAEIVTDITTWNSEGKDTQQDNTKKTKGLDNTDPIKTMGVNSCALEG